MNCPWCGLLEACDCQPPLLTPREGLFLFAVGMLFGASLGWYLCS